MVPKQSSRNPVFTLAKIPTEKIPCPKELNDRICRNPVFTLAKIPTNTNGYIEFIYKGCRNPVFTLAKIPTDSLVYFLAGKKIANVAIQYLPWLRFPLPRPVQMLTQKQLLNCRNPVFTLAKIPTQYGITRSREKQEKSQSSIYPG